MKKSRVTRVVTTMNNQYVAENEAKSRKKTTKTDTVGTITIYGSSAPNSTAIVFSYFANPIDRGTHHILLGPYCKQGSRLHLHVLTVHGCQGSCQKDKTNMSYLVHLHERLQRLQKAYDSSHNPVSLSLRF